MIDELIKKGSLIKSQPDKEKAVNSLELAESKIEKARAELASEFFDDALVSSYMAMRS